MVLSPAGYSFSHFLKSGNSSAFIFGSSISSRRTSVAPVSTRFARRRRAGGR